MLEHCCDFVERRVMGLCDASHIYIYRERERPEGMMLGFEGLGVEMDT